MNDVLQEVLSEKITATLWRKLETLYMTKSLANRLVLKQRLYTFRMGEDDFIRAYISEFVFLLNDLKIKTKLIFILFFLYSSCSFYGPCS